MNHLVIVCRVVDAAGFQTAGLSYSALALTADAMRVSHQAFESLEHHAKSRQAPAC